MADQENWLVRISENGGLPKVLLGPAGDAISRLLGAAVEIPAVHLDRISSKVRDKTLTEKLIRGEIAKKAASQIVENQDVIQRAINSFLHREYRTQINKDEVVRHALESLSENPSKESEIGPEERFIAKLEREVEFATEDEIRVLFGQVLAQEIRAPGTISTRTLAFVSSLEPDIALMINRVIPHCAWDVAYLDCIRPALKVSEITYLEQVGFFTSGKFLPLEFDDSGKILKTPRRDKGFVAFGEPKKKIELNIAILSRPAMDLVNSIGVGLDYDALATLFYIKGANRFVSGPATYFADQVSVKFETEHKQRQTSAE